MVGRQDTTYNWSCQRKPKQWNSTNIYNSGKLLKYYLNICTWLRKGKVSFVFFLTIFSFLLLDVLPVFKSSHILPTTQLICIAQLVR